MKNNLLSRAFAAFILAVFSIGSPVSAAPTLLILSTGAGKMNNGQPTGLWLEEFAVPYNLFAKAGFKILVATPQGGSAPIDPRSKPTSAQEKEWAIAMEKLKQTLPLSEVNPGGIDGVFIPGGHGAMFDLATNAATATLLTELDRQGKIISAVCHGPAALVSARRADGQPLVAGKTVSAFTDAEERAVKLDREMPFLLETRLKELGAKVETAPNFTPKAVRDKNFITGQNPASSGAVAQLVIEALNSK